MAESHWLQAELSGQLPVPPSGGPERSRGQLLRASIGPLRAGSYMVSLGFQGFHGLLSGGKQVFRLGFTWLEWVLELF